MGWARYDYLFAISMIGAFIDAYGIGANDVANSWATSVSSRSVTFRQAMLAAGLCEFLGAVLVGARVTQTIKSGIISLSDFEGDAAVLLLTFTCVIVGSCTWLTIATRNAMPVSTTHTVVGAVIGAGVAANGAGSVKWGWDGVGQIFASWGIAPAVAGGCAAITFLVTKFVILNAKEPVKAGLFLSPVYFFIVAGVLTVAIIVKGSPSLNLKELSPGTTVAAVLGTAAVVALLSTLFWLPWVYCQVVRKDYTIKWYHFFLGPLLWKRQPPADALTSHKSVVPDYYEGHHDEDVHKPLHVEGGDVEGEHRHGIISQEGALRHRGEVQRTESGEASYEQKNNDGDSDNAARLDKEAKLTEDDREERKFDGPLTALQRLEGAFSNPKADTTMPDGRPYPPKYRTYDGSWIEPWNLYTVMRHNALPWVWYTLSAGMRVDIHKMQAHGSAKEQSRLRDIHRKAHQYDNDTEHLFSFLQVLTACTASFAHGANDVSNAVGPLSVVYSIWSTQLFPESKEPTPIWILVYGGAAITIGLATYGWRLMSVLGNRLTLHSPSRGFSMEFGASITVVLASYLGLPVSTTQSITGATVAVALCNGELRSVNWRGVGWILLSWILTLPIAGLISGLLLGIILNAPRYMGAVNV